MIRFDTPGPGRILIIGHRGAEALAPENTWAALQQGYDSGADMLELDVQLTRDREAIVFHDFTLQLKLGDPRWVREMTWRELRTLDVGSWFDPAFATERIPRFADVLNWARGRIALQVDLKHGFVEPQDDRLEMMALDLIQAADMLDQVFISSWDHVALMRVQSRYPKVALGVNLRPRGARSPGRDCPGERPLGLGAMVPDRSRDRQAAPGCRHQGLPVRAFYRRLSPGAAPGRGCGDRPRSSRGPANPGTTSPRNG